MKNNPFAFVMHQLETHLPEPLRPFQAEVKETARRALADKLSDFDLVVKSELEAQVRKLKATEKKIATLEARLSVLEEKLKEKTP
ncbi:Uncharacterized protein conserved in bacteria [Suttonella ornithocola]|uniref:Uncharacterized protein conserved in bacteria n=2 Tax=Suttonella ornithocola TaxID=279832 RepID=A0A380MTD1_9GAMM|nr:Uncharacterized protein conserved in bacteria [Suttonella ornithocola]